MLEEGRHPSKGSQGGCRVESRRAGDGCVEALGFRGVFPLALPPPGVYMCEQGRQSEPLHEGQINILKTPEWEAN